MLSEELEFTRQPDGGLADQIEVLEAFADGDADNTELLMLLIELRSLREQLAELKALPPIGQIVLGDYDSDGTRTARVVCLHDQADWDNFQDGTLLFTEAKPAED
ncbi:hypothetical protein [Yersinia aleksiciae]|uniref:Uncharacterized protein n=1 Tax=Yersinia aleksiciae TaxID=263819 RepID=A0ABN4H968_YERAE|nr:hypothetical protein [Yersinia aleksiciae]AKP34679.1 hypothetical protein ACZ76_14655 [Yersinia aleksiciae]CFQ47493.1 Uncharacterised protein [Yersinia aleksiciae]